ncbi:MAG TPA: acyltransferase [Anaerolineae bacterium]
MTTTTAHTLTRLPAQTAEAGQLAERRWDIDWLRILVVVGMLVPFHAFRVFDTRDPFYVKNNPQSTALNWYLILGDTIGMQLLFMLAGAAAWYSLRHASAGRFAWLRLKRLLVPLLFGLVAVIPPQLYYAARFHGFSGSFLDWLPNYFLLEPEYLGAWDGAGWTPAHLWFILYLLVISLVALPILLLLPTASGQRLIGLAAAAGAPGALLFVPIALATALYLMLEFEPNVLYYLVWFLAGYTMLCDSRFEQAIARVKGPALLLGVLGLVLNTLWQSDAVAALAPIPELLGEGARKTFVAWLLVVGLLGYARTYLQQPPRSRPMLAVLAYLGEASYPFYILHQTVLVILGYYVVQWSLAPGAKYLLLAALTYLLSFAIYDLAVRRTNLTRFLFGMRPRPKEEKALARVA